MSIDQSEILYHCRRRRGLLGIQSKVPVRDEYMLSLLYTPGVAEPCRRINQDLDLAYVYTCKGNAIALLSDASSWEVESLGTLGVIPLLESFAVIARELAGVDIFPFSVDTSQGATLAETAARMAPTVSAIALAHSSEDRLLSLKDEIQQGSGLPALSMDGEIIGTLLLVGLFNAARTLELDPADLHARIRGENSATRWLLSMARDLPFRFSPEEETSRTTPGSHVLISAAGVPEIGSRGDRFVFDLSPEATPTEDASVFSLWNPRDISFSSALVFPGVFRGICDCRLRQFPPTFFRKVAQAIAQRQPERALREGELFPSPLDLKLAPAVAGAIAEAALDAGLAADVDPDALRERDLERLYQRNPSAVATLISRRGEANPDRLAQESLELHEKFGGAIEIESKLRVRDEYMLRLLSPPNILVPAREIAEDRAKVYEYTSKSNLVAVITDGSAVLGLGNIGPEAGLPVMEGKSLLLKTLAGVESIPICLDTQKIEDIIRVVHSLLPILGAVNLEDISAPRCFEIERTLRQMADVPIFHDDQHGTAVVVLAGVLNACRLVGLSLEEAPVVVNGAGASALSVTRLLQQAGAGNIILCDRTGALHPDRQDLNQYKRQIAETTNPEGLRGSLKDLLPGRQIFIGLSAPGVVDQEMVRSMAPDPILFALANPTPEIMPDLALQAGAAVVATGRSDFQNQINNSLAFPGIFRGVLDVRGRTINDEMKIAAAQAIADLIPAHELRPEYIIPHALDARVPPLVAAAVARAALHTDQARVLVGPRVVRDNTKEYLYGGRLDPVAGEPI